MQVTLDAQNSALSITLSGSELATAQQLMQAYPARIEHLLGAHFQACQAEFDADARTRLKDAIDASTPEELASIKSGIMNRRSV